MDRWRGKVAVVTGASAGIGLETAKALVRHGMIVVGLARRKAKMEELMKDVKGPGQFHGRECDITNEDNVIESLNWVKKTFGSLNVLINNAGYLIHKKIEEASTSEMEHTLKVNIFGLLYCSKQAMKLMKENEKEAHIINVNSVLGHKVPLSTPTISFNVYPASKFAVTALSETLRNELTDSKIRVTSVSPGLVKTQMMDSAVERDSNFLKRTALKPEDVTASIIHALSAPPSVEIEEITLQSRPI